MNSLSINLSGSAERRISVADLVFSVTGDPFADFIDRCGAFGNFLTENTPDFHLACCLDGQSVRESEAYGCRESCYEISFEGIDCSYGRADGDIYFEMQSPDRRSLLVLLWKPGSCEVKCTCGKYPPAMTRFGLWMAFNMLSITRNCAAIHSSVNICGGEAAMFLGESGTGKSTHTRLLRERYPEMFLLNDDSPFVRVHEDGTVIVYGSPWSGKTPCYRQEKYPLKAVIRLSQAPFNRIRSLSPLQAIGALLPSAPPAFNYAGETADLICSLVSDIVSVTPLYHLECLPDKAAAELSYKTVFGNGR